MDNFTCNLCHDKGIIIKNSYAEQCGCSKHRTLERLFKNSRLPPAMKKCTFKDFSFEYYSKKLIDKDTPRNLTYYQSAQLAFKAALNFAEDFDRKVATKGILLTGQVGCGKTFLACCIANYLLSRKHSVLFIVVPDLLDMLRATYSINADLEYTEQELLNTAREVPLLILDDLGAHNYTDWTKNKIYSIINYRLNHELPTIITTNISLEDLEEYLGERTTSRIFQMCDPYRLVVKMDIRVLIKNR